MKKIIISGIMSFLFLSAVAQEEKGTKTQSTAVAELMIYGIPYSQYKAEQDAIKRQKPSAQQPAPAPSAKGTASVIPTPEVKVNLKGTSMDPEARPANEKSIGKPVRDKNDVSLPSNNNVEAKPAAPAKKEAVSPAIKGSSADPEAKPVVQVTQPVSATVPAQNSGNSGPATEKPAVKN